MSAIWGKVLWSGKPDSSIDERMSECYRKEYKIDRFCSLTDNSCYMGTGVQHIYPQADQEQLPIKNEDRDFLFTADIVLDNREELSRELKLEGGCPDGEIAYRAYLKWGIDCVKRFYGFFTLAIWDNKNKILYLANDHISARCLYYRCTKEGVVFSTLIDPILKRDSSIELNEWYIKDFFAAPKMLPTVVVEETPYKGIYKLPAATILKITPEKVENYKYWTPEDDKLPVKCTSAREYGKLFRQILEQCIADAIGSNGEIGIALSSGLDSSTVGTLAAEQLKKEQKRLFAYTYVPKDDVDKNTKNKVYNETEDVKKVVAMHDNIEPHFLCNAGEDALNSIEEGLDTLEIPYKAFVNYPSLREIYREAAKAGCKVVLSGQFGNSTISYGNMDPIFFDLYCRRKYITLLISMNNLARHMKVPRKKFMLGYLKYLGNQKKSEKVSDGQFTLEYPFAATCFGDKYPLEERFLQGRMDLLCDRINTQKEYRELLTVFPGSTYIGEWETKLGLKYGMLLRDPTKDRRIISFCYHLPYEYFAYRGTTKWLIRGNMRDMLPGYILDNWDRHGIQNNDWLRRIESNWLRIKPKYEETITNTAVEKYVDIEKIKTMINGEGFSVTSLDASTAQAVFFAYIIALYLKKNGELL